jgi:hypothetical protein
VSRANGVPGRGTGIAFGVGLGEQGGQDALAWHPRGFQTTSALPAASRFLSPPFPSPGTIIIPVYWVGHGGAEVRHDGDGFALSAWACFRRH